MIKTNQEMPMKLSERLKLANQEVQEKEGETPSPFDDDDFVFSQDSIQNMIYELSNMKLKDIFAGNVRALMETMELLDVTEDITYKEMAYRMAQKVEHDGRYEMDIVRIIWGIVTSNKKYFWKG